MLLHFGRIDLNGSVFLNECDFAGMPFAQEGMLEKKMNCAFRKED